MTEKRLAKNTMRCLYVGMGRSCNYSELVKPRLITIKAWKAKGLTDAEIAKNLGVGKTPFSQYKKKFPELAEALKTGLSDALALVENALYKTAIGFSVDEIITVSVTDEDGTQIVKETKSVKTYPPNVAAMIFYLKNRCSKDWQDRRQVGVGDPDGKPLSNIHVVLPDNGMNGGDKG